MTSEIKYPLIELTDWVFNGEKGFVEILEEEKDAIHHINENDLDKHYKRILIDSNGYYIKIITHKILSKTGPLFKFFGQSRLQVIFSTTNSGIQISLDELKRKIISKTKHLYPITNLKLMTESEFISEISRLDNYADIIRVATFLDY
ncbi:hypothetical protein [Carboxylicivirga linearis]|uniref:Uncharacterized protein n=1 Tax=Carboxylicivirga linearis TaxID=1628157 RepID=A0ABS5K286_9BACT|nr:hypothetical protein [Carboxylicivirga linearis]MBS2101283.1 hypothetical protein [Carboxylicivirga linearis]